MIVFSLASRLIAKNSDFENSPFGIACDINVSALPAIISVANRFVVVVYAQKIVQAVRVFTTFCNTYLPVYSIGFSIGDVDVYVEINLTSKINILLFFV